MLVVTPAAADADAYLSVEDADVRSDRDLGEFAAKWASATTEAVDDGTNRRRKEAALRRATLDVDEVVEYLPARFSMAQSLLFPRSIDVIGVVPFIPEAVLDATYRQAIYLFTNAEKIDQSASRRARGMVNFTEPGVTGTISTDEDVGRYAPGFLRTLRVFTRDAVVGFIVRA